MADKKNEKEKTKQEVLFTKEQVLASKKYVNRRDVLKAILEDGKQYSMDQVNSLLTKFMKGKVN